MPAAAQEAGARKAAAADPDKGRYRVPCSPALMSVCRLSRCLFAANVAQSPLSPGGGSQVVPGDPHVIGTQLVSFAHEMAPVGRLTPSDQYCEPVLRTCPI